MMVLFYLVDICRFGQCSVIGYQQLFVFQISIVVQFCFEFFEELLLQCVVQIGIFYLIVELGQQCVWIQLYILQYICYGIVFVGQFNFNVVVREDEYVYCFGIVEQVVYVVEDFLIGVNYEEVQYWWVFWVVFWYWYGGGDFVVVYVVIDGVIGIVGDVQQYCVVFW